MRITLEWFDGCMGHSALLSIHFYGSPRYHTIFIFALISDLLSAIYEQVHRNARSYDSCADI